MADPKTPAEIRAEKLVAAMKALGEKHVLHSSHRVPRRERRSDPAAVDVRRTFERVAGADWNRPKDEAPVLALVRNYRER